jgi:hypothetical protein
VDTERAQYGWMVTVDHDYDHDPETHQRLSLPSRVGMMGPHNIHPDVRAALLDGTDRGRLWRTLYDSDPGMTLADRLVHQGRLLTVADVGLAAEDDLESDVDFGPLSDLSTPDCGACEIQYHEKDAATGGYKWKSL